MSHERFLQDECEGSTLAVRLDLIGRLRHRGVVPHPGDTIARVRSPANTASAGNIRFTRLPDHRCKAKPLV